MELQPRYAITELWSDQGGVRLYRARRHEDGTPVLLKRPSGATGRRAHDEARLAREYELCQRLDTSVIPRLVALETHETQPVLVFEDDGSEPLWSVVPKGTALPLSEFLPFAIRLCRALEALHAKGLVHRGINPHNILLHPHTRELKITGLELASLSPFEPTSAQRPGLIDSALPYMSPEQTGRTGQAIDHRTDLYSLGMTLFELRAGRLPFEESDQLGLIHAHLARTPARLTDTAPDTPEVLASIVDKLLSKAADDRYQSAHGLRCDLEACLEQLTPDGDIEEFPIAVHDISEHFIVPLKLYGREADVSALASAFQRVMSTGRPGLVSISGYAGIGKSALVNALHPPVARAHGFLEAGKCDALQRRTPYFPFARACRNLMLGLLAEPEARLTAWCACLQSTLGANAQLVVDVVPELERVIGKQPAVPVLAFEEAERRFYRTFWDFLRVFARKEHPLVLFLDDLQWVDSASLKLLESMFENDEAGYLLVVCAYRDNEIDAGHALHKTLEAIRRHGAVTFEPLSVTALSEEHLLALLSDTLRRSRTEVAPLAQLIHTKTADNPFFVIQFLTSLYQDGLLRFDHGLAGFAWDIEAIRARGFTDNVVDLMVDRLQRLPDSTRRALELASCIGSTFEVGLLADICKQSEDDAHRALWEALRAGVLLRDESTYRFAHDRVHQAAYSLIGAAKPDEVHLQVGRLLLEQTSADALGERIFDIVSQLNRGERLIACCAERQRCAELNLVASRRAKTAAAYAAAMDYAAVGLNLLGDKCWFTHYQLTLDLHIERADSAYLSKDKELAGHLLMSVLAHAVSRRDRAAAYDILVQLHTSTGQMRRACDLALECLREFGVELQAAATKQDVAREGSRILEMLGAHPTETLAQRAPMRDPEREALMRVLTNVSSAALFFNTSLWALFSCERVRLTLEYGNAPGSAHAYSTYALALNAFFGDLRRAHSFGKLAMSMVEEQGLSESRAPVTLNTCVFINYWVEPIDKIVAAVHRTYVTGVENDALAYACYASCILPIARLLRGDTLAEVKTECDAQFAFLTHHHFHMVADSVEILLLFLQRLMGGGQLDARAIEARMVSGSWRLNAFLFYAREIQVQFLYGAHAAALEAAEKAEEHVLSAPGFLAVADYVFYYALTAAQCRRYDKLVALERTLRDWAESCPSNFLDRMQLVAAELARVEGRSRDAMQLYEQAIESARQRGYVHHEAIGCELAADFYEAQGLYAAARCCLRESHAAYMRWGATAKAEALARREPSLLREQPKTGMLHAVPNEIDLASVVQASQTISSELRQDELTRTLVRVVVQQAGAQRGRLILARDGRLEIAAAAESDTQGVRVDLLTDMPLAASGLVPETVVQYVVRAGEPLILADASSDSERFSLDPYIRNRRARSILCLPLMRGEQAVGYLYLENSLTRGAFTQERLMMAEALASQAAISLENARLYDALRASEAKLANFFDGLPVGVLAVDAQGHPVIANRKATEIAGEAFDPTRIYVSGTDELYPVESTPFGKALRGESSVIDDGELHRDGRSVPLAIWGTPIRSADGYVRYAIVAFQDISAQRQAEAERARLEEQLQLTERLDSIGRLAGGVAHDLNNLLMPMLVYSDLAMHELDATSSTREQIAEVHEAAERASELVRQLLAVGRRQVLAPKELELGNELRALEPMLRRLMRSDIAFEIQPDAAPSFVRADRSQLERAFMNLAINALDAMPQAGQLRITTENVNIEPGSRAIAGVTPGAYVVVRVIDNGCGMDAQTRSRIFEPFFTTKVHGTGLGLPTVYGLVKQHGGHIDVHSELGRGTNVAVFLPRIHREFAATQHESTQARGAAERRRTPRPRAATILVVDDDPRVLTILEGMLKRDPYRVRGSSDPEKALGIARELGDGLDVLVTDVIMPGMNGRELFDRIVQMHPKLRVLFVSGYSADVISVQGLLAPGFELMQKPFSANTLHDKLAKVLAQA